MIGLKGPDVGFPDLLALICADPAGLFFRKDVNLSRSGRQVSGTVPETLPPARSVQPRPVMIVCNSPSFLRCRESPRNYNRRKDFR
jgi:hypothetical protein